MAHCPSEKREFEGTVGKTLQNLTVWRRHSDITPVDEKNAAPIIERRRYNLLLSFGKRSKERKTIKNRANVPPREKMKPKTPLVATKRFHFPKKQREETEQPGTPGQFTQGNGGEPRTGAAPSL